MNLLEKAADGCHKYGWLINLVVMGLMFAYFMGTMNTTLLEVKDRLIQVEIKVNVLQGQVDTLQAHVDMLEKRKK